MMFPHLNPQSPKINLAQKDEKLPKESRLETHFLGSLGSYQNVTESPYITIHHSF